METTHNRPIENAGRDEEDIVATEPKSAGLPRPGAVKDEEDIVATEPKSAGLPRPGRS